MNHKRMKAVELAKIDIIDGATSSFLASLDRALGRLNTKMQRYIVDLEGGASLATTGRNITRAVNAQAQIEEMLLESGYRDSTNRLIAAYDRVATLSLDSLAAAGINDSFNQVDIRALNALKNLDLSRWEALGGDLARAMQSSIMDSVISGGTVRDLQGVIEAQLRGLDENDAAVYNRAKTLANTLTSSFDRTVTNRMAKTSGITTFVYIGPDDDLTRPFCQAMLSGGGDAEFNIPVVEGEPAIYTEDQIDGMDNGTEMSVWQAGGGYNCRHSLRPVSVQVAQEVLA